MFAKKLIPKRTQFGPLKGSLSEVGEKEKSDNSFLVNVAGKRHKIVVSDESRCTNSLYNHKTVNSAFLKVLPIGWHLLEGQPLMKNKI